MLEIELHNILGNVILFTIAIVGFDTGKRFDRKIKIGRALGNLFYATSWACLYWAIISPSLEAVYACCEWGFFNGHCETAMRILGVGITVLPMLYFVLQINRYLTTSDD